MEDELKIEQRHAIHFCVRLGKTATETCNMLVQAYHEDAVARRTVFDWHKKFSEGCESAADASRSGRPREATSAGFIEAVEAALQEDRRSSISYLSARLGISYGSVQHILTVELQMSRVCARWVPRLLTQEQRDHRVDVCHKWKNRFQREGWQFLKRVITCDETWIYFFDPESKQQSSVWKHSNSPPPAKAMRTKSTNKEMHLIFFDIGGIVYDHAVPPHTTVTGQYYADVLDHPLTRHLRNKRPNLVESGWILHHDNAPAHGSRVVHEVLQRRQISLLEHPPYSPDLAPCDFWPFPRVKSQLRGQKFESSSALQGALQAILKSIARDGLQHVFQEWRERWTKCIQTNGCYFEKL
jgi:histone-lysine N-methyltransferase SETMAR